MMIKLSKILESLESGGRPKGGATLNDNGIPSLGAEHLDNNGSFNFKSVKYIPEEFFNKLKNGIVETENILIVKDGATTGKVSFVDENFPFMKSAVNEHIFLLKINKSKAFPRYVFQYLRTPQGQRNILRDFRGATVGGISRGFVEFVSFPLPKLPIQIQIANILSKTENLITQRRRSIDLLDDFLKNMFLEMFGDPAFNRKNWDKQKFKDLIVKGDKINYGVVQPGDDNNEGIPIIRVGDFKGIRINSNNLKLIDPAVEKKHKASRLVGDEVLLACVGATIGKIALANESHKGFNIVRAIARVRSNPDKLNRLYLCNLLLTSFYQLSLKNLARTIAQPTLNIKQIEELNVIVPPIKLQIQYAQIAEKIESLKAQYQSSLQELENLYGSLSQRAFRGELVFPQNEEELPAGLVDTDKIDLFSEKIVPVEKEETDEVDIPMKSTKKIIPNLQPVANHREKIKQSYKIFSTIKSHYRTRYFTFEEFSEKLIESGHDYKFEAIRNEIFNLLRENKLRQVFADAAFKSAFDKTHPDYNEVQKLEERIYLTLKSERK